MQGAHRFVAQAKQARANRGKILLPSYPLHGEKACAYLIPREGAAVPSVQELAGFLVAQGLAKYKCPERIEAVTSFPVTRVGKLDRQQMRQSIADKIAAERP